MSGVRNMRKVVIAGIFGMLMLSMALVGPVTAHESKIVQIVGERNSVMNLFQKIKEKLGTTGTLGDGVPDLSLRELLGILALILLFILGVYCNPAWYIAAILTVLMGLNTPKDVLYALFVAIPWLLIEWFWAEWDDDNRDPS